MNILTDVMKPCLLLAAIATNGYPGTAVAVPDDTLAAADPGVPIIRSVAPVDTDPNIDTRSGDHLVALPEEVSARIGRLLVFYPGTGARPEQYRSFITRAAQRGYHAVGLDYENSESINFQVCRAQPPDCPERARLEILTGEESPYIEPDVAVTNSAFNRLAKLLQHERDAHPDEGWNLYLSPSGEPAWNRIAFAGHSQGGGHAAMTAKLHAVPRVLLFGATEPAVWTTEPFATSAGRFWGLVHEQEPIRNGVIRSWDNMGIPGETARISTLPPSAQIQRMVAIAQGCTGDPASTGYYHNCYIVDGWMPAASSDGSPAFAAVWDYMLSEAPPSPMVERGNVATLTPAGESWIDPEVLRFNDELRMTWQDPQGGIWLAMLDPLTGLLASEPARIGEGGASLGSTYNGPEFGVDRQGWAVYYTQLIDGRGQAVRLSADGTHTVLTTGTVHFSPLPTRDAARDSTRLLMLRRPPNWGTLLWLDTASPQSEHDLAYLPARTDGDGRWAVGTASLATNAYPAYPGQMVLLDTDTGAVTVVTGDASVKTAPYAWIAPEADGGLLALAIVDDTQLVVWAPDGNGGWREHIALTSPSTGHPYLGSPEPFVAGGRSFVSLTVRDASNQIPGVTDSQVWIVGIDPLVRFQERCDDAQLRPATRVDPEVLLGDEQAFVYYYAIRPTGSEVMRCATGIQP